VYSCVQGRAGTSRDDGARREVDSLPHQVSAHTPLLALEALRDGLEWAARARGRGLHARQSVCDEGGQMVLQQRDVLQLDVVWRAVALVLAQRAVGAHDVHELDGEVVLSAPHRGVHLDRGAHLRGECKEMDRRINRRGFTEFISGVIRGNFRAGLPPPVGVTVVLLKSYELTRGFSETLVWSYSRFDGALGTVCVCCCCV